MTVSATEPLVPPEVSSVRIETDRLILRQWQQGDLAPVAALRGDVRVGETLGGTLTGDQSHAFAQRMAAEIAARGWGFFAMEDRRSGDFAGFGGLRPVPFEAAFTPAIELGWTLSPALWGQGLATEAARAASGFAFETLGLDEVVAYTAASNQRSQAVMQRLGMVPDPALDFDHPRLAPDHPLARHVLYRLPRP
ncbi:GNAT family N-acetyltransferase [Tistrella mobilis]|uniref:GMP synthase [glutamine-hydrolyzing] n=1 Tax=Tistrella mobilis (strain KA081020-065) TaxID=1110502 RepID=I3TLF4_TISMK|nr:GNAT family N-acetyltransferase [Tistrella mobilis]AFK53592.1 putative GMP synthase [glutamine-hydrolyzing] [Tistrella mobilis KA081020-065]